ncbi:MAG: undecaprenyldiphospho-muramoylpentapeptide beta-N-acetylglucosaminyltransferase [Flavobacteriales bacterium]|nr:undecaprenyldiphospho-muramoylpentapeptide beta-N-acetylglucosaminyltransferase [Flavobacteriales bacterium]
MTLNKVIISGGGTGGHIFPAIAIANALKEMSPGTEILFVGAKGKMEMGKVPAAGYNIVGLEISGLSSGLSISNLTLPFRLMKALWQARKVIKKFKPQVIIGVGGYASAAVAFTGAKMNIPILLQEQNSYPGKTNRFLSRYASRICVAYPDMQTFFPASKIVYTGNPVRKEIEHLLPTAEQGQHLFNLSNEKPILLAFGGSQGAKAINEGIENALPLFHKHGIQVLWQTGTPFYQRALNTVKNNGYDVKVFEFIREMNYAYAAADMVVARAGAITISELQVAGKASILIPLPTAAENHQYKNALQLSSRDAALILSNNDCPTKLGDTVINMIKDKPTLHALETRIKQMAAFDAAKTIASEVITLAG